MDKAVISKFRAYVAGKKDEMPADDSNIEQDDNNAEGGGHLYDIACQLCDALGVSEEKADSVAHILSQLKELE